MTTFNYSIADILKATYSDIQWDATKFSRVKETHRNFLEELAKKLGFQKWEVCST